MEQLCFDSGLLQGRFLRFLEKSKEMEKQKKADGKAQKLAKLKRNMAALSANSPKTDDSSSETEAATSAQAEPQASAGEVQSEVKNEAKETATV